MRSLIKAVLLWSVCLLPALSETHPNTIYGVALSDIYPTMRYSDRIRLTGDFEHDRGYFIDNYPRYLSNLAAAKAEGSTVEAIFDDNYQRRAERIAQEPDDSIYRQLYANNRGPGKADQSNRWIENGFCKDPLGDPVLSPYFYCFEYNGAIYQIVDKLDYYDTDTDTIRPLWKYAFYSKGQFKDFFKPGPYRLLQHPVISGVGAQPDIHID